MRRSSEPSDAPIDGRIRPEVARAIRLVVLDVDGVLTDTAVWVGADAEGRPIEFKRFDIQDGLGIKLLRSAGVEVAIVSGRVSEATTIRARELGVEECHQDGGAHKLPVVQGLMDARGLEWSEIAMLGDDIPDLPVLRRVGLPATVANAVPEVMEVADWVSRKEGGKGAVREFIRALLLARGTWSETVDRYVGARSDG